MTDTILGDADDTYFGTTRGDKIYGGLGDDVIFGGGGNDLVHGDAGNDRLIAGAIGRQKLLGDDGNDLIAFQDSRKGDLATGGAGLDTLQMNWLNSATLGLSLIFSGNFAVKIAGKTTLAAKQFEVLSILGTKGSDDIRGGNGDDQITGGGGNDSLFGGGGNDTITPGSDGAFLPAAGGFTADGGAGVDLLHLMLFNATDAVTLTAGALTTFTFGGQASQAQGFEQFWLSLGDGNDRITGGTLNDTISTSGGTDVIYGMGGDDYITAEAEDDLMYGGDGNDTLYAQSGLDDAGAATQVYGGAGNDSLRAGFEGGSFYGGDGDDVYAGFRGPNRVATGTGNDLLYLYGTDTVDAGTGNDTVTNYLNELKRLVKGGDGRDLMISELDRSVINPLEGASITARLTPAGVYEIRLGGDVYGRFIGFETYEIHGDRASDSISGGTGADTLMGDIFADPDNINATDNDSLAGLGGGDLLQGRGGNDLMDGGQGNDTLQGDTGSDTMTGGAGADLFLFTAISESRGAGTQDLLTDFEIGLDKIDLAQVDVDTLTDGVQHFTFVGTDALSSQPGTLRYGFVGGTTVISGSTNSDAFAEFEIVLTGRITLTDGDFVLS